ncbi:hypothetical protein IO99_07685 [Clostridium sulfidigenes]|uniref:CN hydrolase domain-containing protein n=1 Tax=Clostridium sulfidigenes TaxID=318464 RepID=A0A084JDS4_9CLOT|nr:hypothetical protein [Clostridium sulfidigenes]KEZ87108.1 hypothetical protein IO99_07685 [Clostridium sulfidigenes]
MKILIGQPLHENGLKQISNEIINNREVDIVLYPEGYLANEELLKDVCNIAKEYRVMIITSYRMNNKDRAVIINNHGEKILERAKTPPDDNEKLYNPLVVNYNKMNIGYLLCMEILKGVRDLQRVNETINFIAHPIGVGMFSDEQFQQWITEAKNIARIYKTIVIGTSHADGSYRNCGISIPISYCIDSNGEEIFISKADTRTRVVDIDRKEVKTF